MDRVSNLNRRIAVSQELVKMDGTVVRTAPTSLEILDAAVRGGVTSENVAVVKEIIAMRREEVALESKAKFNRSFFELRKEISTMKFYADKEAQTDSGKVAFRYCSEAEITSKLDPVLFKHGFTLMFGQETDGDKSTAVVTLTHEDGHDETRRYSVRSGGTNRMKDATAADTGATTSAWRHLVIKWFGLKSRTSETDDARNLGDIATKITKEQADELEHRVAMANANKVAFFEFAGANVKSFSDIAAIDYPRCDRMLKRKEGVK